MLVFSVYRSPVFGLFEIPFGAVILAVDQRGAAVLLAREIAHQRESVVGLILVGGGFRAGADDVYAEDGEADDNRSEAQERCIPEHLFLLERGNHSPEAQGEHGHQEERGAGIVRQAETVHEEEVYIGRKFGQQRNDYEEDYRQNGDSHEENLDKLPERERFVLTAAVVEHEHEGGDRQEVEQVHTYAQAHQEGNEHYPAVRMRGVGGVVPLCHGPEDHGREKAGHGIHFTFHRAEPEGVGEAVHQGTDKAGANDGNCLSDGVAFIFAGSDEPLREPHYGEIQEQDGERADDGVHGVHRHGRALPFAEQREDTGEELKSGVSGGMAHLELIRRRYELAAVPERCGGLYGRQIGERGNHEGDQSAYQIEKSEFLIVHSLQS